MKNLINLLATFFLSHQAMAILPAPSTHSIPGLEGASLEIRFTNPQCGTHFYSEPVETNSGGFVKAKPDNGYCRGKQNYSESFNWAHSPRMKLLDWIADEKTEEVFFTFQSISDSATLGALCEAIRDRGIKVTFVISRNRGPREEGGYDPLIDMSKTPIVETEGSQKKFDRAYEKLTRCGLPKDAPQPVGIIRGHTGKKSSSAIGWAHNKFFVINPNSKEKIHFASGSGNLTTIGVSSNHENWLFFEDVPVESHLAQNTLCMMSSQLNDKAHLSIYDYKKINGRCLANIPKHYKKAKGITTYHVPGEGERAIKETLIPAFSSSDKITMAAHLFGYPNLFMRGLSCAASKKPRSSCFKKKGGVPAFENGIGKSEVRLITDDDIHWLRVGQVNDQGKVGYNDPWEAHNVEKVDKAGVKVRYIQTAHQEGFIQLHHNKMILFENGPKEGVWTGAGNFTMNAMHSNFENYFFITIPSVIEAYRQQLDSVWDKMSTSYENMPKLDHIPVLPEEGA